MAQKMHRSLWLTFMLVVVLTLVASCGAPEEEPAPTPNPTQAVATAEAVVQEVVAAYPIAATAWTVDYFGPPEEPYPMLPDTRATVTYFWDRYAGYDGCNWFLGVYSANAEGEMRNNTPSRTINICQPPELYDQAGLFVSSLLNVTEYALEGENLIENTVDDQRLLTLKPAPVVPMPSTVWELKFWWSEDREQWAPIVPASMTTITFDAEGQATGFGGCNDFTVTYEGDLQIEKVMEATDTYAELPTLTFGSITAQPVTCEEPEGIMEQEQGFYAALGSVAYYFKLGGMLLMVDAEGTPVMLLGARS
jgi:heat shock protein HslJ